MLNARRVEKNRYKEIKIRTSNGIQEVKAERVKFFDPAKKFEILKYSKKKVALVEVSTGKVMLQDALYISVIKNGMSKYFDQKDQWGMLNERAQIVCESGTLKTQKKKKSNPR